MREKDVGESKPAVMQEALAPAKGAGGCGRGSEGGGEVSLM